MPRGAIRWESDTLTPTLAKLTIVIYAETTRIAHQQAERVQAYMVKNAPWTDRTGNARRGLYCKAEPGIDEFTLELGHGVDYGLYLEVRFNGIYAIIQPTLEEMGPAVMHALDGLLVRSAAIARAGGVAGITI